MVKILDTSYLKDNANSLKDVESALRGHDVRLRSVELVLESTTDQDITNATFQFIVSHIINSKKNTLDMVSVRTITNSKREYKRVKRMRKEAEAELRCRQHQRNVGVRLVET